jgi:hypothetical protein
MLNYMLRDCVIEVPTSCIMAREKAALPRYIGQPLAACQVGLSNMGAG